MKNQRSAQVIITEESTVLRNLRLKHGLTMQGLAKMIGVTDSYISHIENGRANAPTGESLERFLKIYGIGAKYFYELAREVRGPLADLRTIEMLLPKIKPHHLRTIRLLVEKSIKEN